MPRSPNWTVVPMGESVLSVQLSTAEATLDGGHSPPGSARRADPITHQLRGLYRAIEREPIPESILVLLRHLGH